MLCPQTRGKKARIFKANKKAISDRHTAALARYVDH